MCPLFFILSLLQCLYLLHGLNHSACYNSEFIIDSPLCESTGYLAPKKFLFGQISPSSTCRTELRGQRDYHIVRKCCKVHNGDTILKEVCIPGQKALLSSPMSQLARYCSRGNRCDSGKRLTSPELFTGDYVSLEFDCVHAKDEIHVNSDEVLYGKNVYLISDKKDGSVRNAKCAVYSNNPQSSIVIALVDNRVLSGTCTLSFASSMSGTSTINCAKTEIVNGCNNVLYTTSSSRVDINLTMNVLANNSDRQFLWMMASVSDGGNLTVACGKKIPPDGASSTQSTKSRLSIQTSSHNYMTSSYSKATYPRAARTTDIWASSTGSMTTTATGLSRSVSSKGSEESTLMHLNSDSSPGLQFTTSSSPLLTTLGRIQAAGTTVPLPPTKRSSPRPQTYQPSPSLTGTLSPPLTHSTTGGIQSAGHTSYLTRPSQRLSLSLFEASSSSSVTPFLLMKTTTQISHPVTVSSSQGTVPTPSSPTSTNIGPRSSAFMSFSPPRSSPSSSTSMVRTVPPSNVTSPRTNRTSSHQPSRPMLTTSNTTSFESHTTTGTTYSSRISRTTTVPITSTATWLTTSKSTHGSRRSTQVQLSKINSMSDSSPGFQYTTSSSPLLTTLGRMQTRTETSLPSTKRSSSRPQTYQPSPSMTGTLSPPLTHSTTGGIQSAGHTSYLTRPSQRLSSSLFEASSSSSVTPVLLMKTTKQTSHPVTVSSSQGTVPTPSSPTSTSGGPKSSAFMSLSPQSTSSSPSSSTSMMWTVPPSNVPSPRTNRTSSHKSSRPMLATFNTTSFESHTTTGTTYSSRISRTTTVPITSTATWLTTSKSTHGSRRSTQVQLSKINSMSDSSPGFQYTTSSSPLLTTLGRMQTRTETSLPSTKRSSSRPQTYQPSPSMTGTLSPPLTHSTTGGIQSAGHTSYLTRPSQRLSSSLFEASSSSSVTPFLLMKTTKQTSHPVTVSSSQGTVPTPSSPTSTSGGPKSSAFMSLSPQSTSSSPSSSTSMMRTVPPSNVPSPRTNRTSSHKSSRPMLATSNTTSFESHTTTGTTYSSRISRTTTVPITSTATWLTTSKSTHGSRRSTQVQLSKINSMSDSSPGFQYTTSSSPLLTTLGRMQTRTETSLPSTKRSSSRPQTYQPSPSMTGTLSPPLTHSTTGGIQSSGHTSYLTRPSQRLSSSLFEASSSSSVTPFLLMTTKQTSHPVTVSSSQGTVPAPSSPTSTSGGPKFSAYMTFSPQSTRSSPSSSTSMMRTVPPSNVPSPRTKRSGVTTLSITPSAAEQSAGTPGTPVNMFSMYLPTVSTQSPGEESTFNTGKSGNDDDKIAFILEVITSLAGATLLILMVITTAMCLCFKKRMNDLKRNSRHRKKLAETRASNLERRSVVSLESGYCSNSISS